MRAAQVGAQFPTGLLQPAWELPFPAGRGLEFHGRSAHRLGRGQPVGRPRLCSHRHTARLLHLRPLGDRLRAGGRGALGARHAAARPGWRRQRTDRLGAVVFTSRRCGASAGWNRGGARCPVGHPSCEGGRATGAHVHIARKYNGEWIGIDRAFPFVLSGWQVIPGENSYQGKLVQNDQIVTAGRGTSDCEDRTLTRNLPSQPSWDAIIRSYLLRREWKMPEFQSLQVLACTPKIRISLPVSFPCTFL